jgi:hypothetical protein
MTKLSIEIADIADQKACMLALRQAFAALEGHYGEKEAENIWRSGRYDLRSPKWQARFDASEVGARMVGLDFALLSSGLKYDDARLICQYCAMAKPNKEGLARELARRNDTLHEKWREWLKELPPASPMPPAPFGPTGSTSPQTILRHIKRVFQKHQKEYAAIRNAPPEMREEFRQFVEYWCGSQAAMRMITGRKGGRRKGGQRAALMSRDNI